MGLLMKSAQSGVVGSGGGGGQLLFAEGFEDASFTSRGWYDLATLGASSLVVDNRPGSNGTHALQWPWTINVVPYPNPRGSARHLFTPTETLYVSYWLKHSSNWIGSGQTFHPHQFNILSDLDDQFAGPAQNFLDVYIEDNYNAAIGGANGLIEMQDALNINSGSNNSNINVDLTHITENRAVAGCNGNPSNGTAVQCYDAGGGLGYVNGIQFRTAATVFTNATGPNYKGDWHHVEVYVQMNTITGGIADYNGVLRYSVDGTVYFEQLTAQFRTGQHPTMKFAQLVMGPYMDNCPATQTLWVDDLTVMTNYP